jgi:hypothetical protein
MRENILARGGTRDWIQLKAQRAHSETESSAGGILFYLCTHCDYCCLRLRLTDSCTLCQALEDRKADSLLIGLLCSSD